MIAAAPHPDPHVVATLNSEDLDRWVKSITNNALTILNFLITAYHLIELAKQKEWNAWSKLRRLKRRPKPAK